MKEVIRVENQVEGAKVTRNLERKASSGAKHWAWRQEVVRLSLQANHCQ